MILSIGIAISHGLKTKMSLFLSFAHNLLLQQFGNAHILLNSRNFKTAIKIMKAIHNNMQVRQIEFHSIPWFRDST